jgi:hypothetical protein
MAERLQRRCLHGQRLLHQLPQRLLIMIIVIVTIIMTISTVTIIIIIIINMTSIIIINMTCIIIIIIIITTTTTIPHLQPLQHGLEKDHVDLELGHLAVLLARPLRATNHHLIHPHHPTPSPPSSTLVPPPLPFTASEWW